MADVVFHDFSIEVQRALESKILATLEECAGEVESAAKRNSRVDTGQTKNSFRHKVDESTRTAYIGSDLQNAVWEEFGTGEFALNGNGRRGGWRYKDARGKWHKTLGKKPSRALYKAFSSKKTVIKNRFKSALKEL